MPTISQIKRVRAQKAREKVQILREEAGVTLREAAKYAGVSAATFCRVEAGKAPDIRTAFRLARFFETSIEELFAKFRI